MDDPETVVDALRLLRSDGYEIEFQLIDGHLQCNADDRACPASDAIVERVYRFEGASDPGDEMVVFGLRDPSRTGGACWPRRTAWPPTPSCSSTSTGSPPRFGS